MKTEFIIVLPDMMRSDENGKQTEVVHYYRRFLIEVRGGYISIRLEELHPDNTHANYWQESPDVRMNIDFGKLPKLIAILQEIN